MPNQTIVAMIACLAIAGTACAQIDFTQRTVSQVSTEAQLRAAAGTATTSRIDGVTFQPSVGGDLFAIHVDGANVESFLRVDAASGTATKLTDQSTVISQLGSPYSGALTLVGGFVYNAAANALYFSENFTEPVAGEVSLIRLNASTGAATLVTRSTDLEGLNDHTILADGTIVTASPDSVSVGIVDVNTGIYTERLEEADFLAASPGAVELPPEAIAANPVTDETFIFCHDDLDLFSVPNITAASPTLNRLTQPELASVDMHDLAVDEDGNLYGLDVPSSQILIVRKSDGVVFAFPYTEISTALSGGPFDPTFFRGLGARRLNSSQSEVFIASASNNYGIVRVVFGADTSSVDDWNLY